MSIAEIILKKNPIFIMSDLKNVLKILLFAMVIGPLIFFWLIHTHIYIYMSLLT